MPSGITSIGTNAFDGCINLKIMVKLQNLTRIEESVFAGCENITINEWPYNPIGANGDLFIIGILPKHTTPISISNNTLGINGDLRINGNLLKPINGDFNIDGNLPEDTTWIGITLFYDSPSDRRSVYGCLCNEVQIGCTYRHHIRT